LPREVCARGAFDRRAEIIVGDVGERRFHVGRELRRWWDLAVGALLGGIGGEVERTNAKAKLLHLEAALAKTRDELGREKR